MCSRKQIRQCSSLQNIFSFTFIIFFSPKRRIKKRKRKERENQKKKEKGRERKKERKWVSLAKSQLNPSNRIIMEGDLGGALRFTQPLFTLSLSHPKIRFSFLFIFFFLFLSQHAQLRINSLSVQLFNGFRYL